LGECAETVEIDLSFLIPIAGIASASSVRAQRRTTSVMSTKKASKKASPDQMRAEYDLRGGERGKFFAEYQKGTNVVLLEPDVAKSFPNLGSSEQSAS
jgi:hypothetical protein